jgi:hypothetical protein
MAKIGFTITRDYYTQFPKVSNVFVWADDGLKHPYDMIPFRFMDHDNNVLFVGNMYEDNNKKSQEMAVQWCCNKIVHDKNYDEVELHFETSVKGLWVRKF